MASRKTRAKRRQERIQQLQRNTAILPAQASIEELKTTNPSEAQQTLLLDGREGAPAKEVEQRIECVPLERIVTEQYQRILNMKNVAGIVKNFDPAKLGVLVVSHREDGTYAVLDGQHRLTALRRLGYDAANCIVLEGMTIQQEADYFRRQNENKQSLRINDTFNASLWAEDAESLRIKELMDKYGFRHGKSGQPMCICAIGALQRILRRFGDRTLELTLACIAATWPHDSTILRGEMLAGLGEFWRRYGEKLTVAQFEARMRKHLPMEMYQEARRRTQGKTTPATAFNKTIRFTMCAVYVSAYNKQLRTNSPNRLELEWDHEDEE
jgi:hypothetical protein